jgi:predicted esterase YcpF (UPF0227 family)
MSHGILYIHGLASCGTGNKSRALAAFFGTRNLVAPDLPMEPAQAAALLEEIVLQQDFELVVGSSLGGFHAVWLNRHRAIPTVLVNPAIRPWESLEPYVGTLTNWCFNETFELTAAHLRQLRTMAREPDPATESYLVLLGERDEILDHREAAALFSGFDVRISAGEDHRFRKFSDWLPEIDAFRTAHLSKPRTGTSP